MYGRTVICQALAFNRSDATRASTSVVLRSLLPAYLSYKPGFCFFPDK